MAEARDAIERIYGKRPQPVEARDVKGLRPNVLDSSAIIDGRIADLAESGLFQSRFVVPSFVVDDDE